MKRLTKGYKIGKLLLKDVDGASVHIPDSTYFIHLQFRRFSGCPICEVHLGRMASRSKELINNNVKEIIIFYSDDNSIKYHLSEIPFTFVGDPSRKLYEMFGVGESIMSIVNPIAWIYAIKGALNKIVSKKWFLPSRDESMLGLPADFMINPDGVIVDLHYGTHAYDQWDLETIIEKANEYSGVYYSLEQKV